MSNKNDRNKRRNGSKEDDSHPHFSAKNIINFLLMITVPFPTILFVQWLWSQGDAASMCADKTHAEWNDLLPLIQEHKFVEIAYSFPGVTANAIFFFGVGVLFWLISLVQSSTWLIDPYWTFVPVFVAFYYKHHPCATSLPSRSVASMVLICLWSLRLTHNYFRREEWKFGVREDWRFTNMRKNPSFWWISFFAAFLSQQPMLMGISLPLLSVHTHADPWTAIDTLACVLCVTGITTAFFADNTLRAYMLSEKKSIVLEDGIWYYSRHPNYFGEILFWSSFYLFSFGLGDYAYVWGTAFNSYVLHVVVDMTEERILERADRRKPYMRYQARTSRLIPWFKGTSQQ